MNNPSLNGHQRIIDPTRIPVNFRQVQCPVSQPVGFTLQTQNGIDMLVVGGISPMVAVAAQVAGGISNSGASPERIARDACAIASEIFSEEQRLAREAQDAKAAAEKPAIIEP